MNTFRKDTQGLDRLTWNTEGKAQSVSYENLFPVIYSLGSQAPDTYIGYIRYISLSVILMLVLIRIQDYNTYRE